ncbi:hypothetical protein P872_08760 [Rhodonellum psychrophilum GCM71 = DSM 17998]|uniref:Transglutaminase-like domain-containing protein n=2 Tax=Rhodonellum TaxID=336827 RepID=U5BWW1_9BACT|nr:MULTISPECIES: transglutaminase family protein [Rhodonellum]ERM82059.1 hypothetical protein P872_08760 [Rhodonellum psychrophilum GCM71 = DSM 17998]SDZ07771.1 Transglutaminase-like enzyme, putative cysteine protease [Rhodonellum ikkaensis]
MKIQIDHLSRYTYEERVPLNPHDLYLIPQQRSYFKTLDSQLEISPNPMGIHERISAEGNPYYQTWFKTETDQLEIRSKLTLEIGDFNPYAFILQAGLSFPFDYFAYPSYYLETLALYRTGGEDGARLVPFAKDIMAQSSDHISFLANLVASIHQNWKHIIREEPGLMTSKEVFEEKKGSCRDLSWMLMEMLRSLGLATRFVSGYAFNPELDEGHELHGWVEVFLPGAGWIGLDPSLGLLTDQNYIPLATSFHPAHTLPIMGTYGGKAGSNLFSEVFLKEL